MMTRINKGRVARLVAGVAVSAMVAFGMTTDTAQAYWDHPEHDYHGLPSWAAPRSFTATRIPTAITRRQVSAFI
jgi:hypothetical protein